MTTKLSISMARAILDQPIKVLKEYYVQTDKWTTCHIQLIQLPCIDNCIEPHWRSRMLVVAHMSEWYPCPLLALARTRANALLEQKP
jgi:hypothetical protein